MRSYWDFYDRLIESADPHEVVTNLSIGACWTFLGTDAGHFGTAMTVWGSQIPESVFLGKTLRETAMQVKSWDYTAASVGLAAINASLNRRELYPAQDNPDAFLRYKEQYFGKKVAVVGHFAYLEQRLMGKCDLYILERKPSGSDYPDPACEYLLPEMDTVVITGSAVINKTMPRLLDLSQNAFTVISGPSTPMDSHLFDWGVDSLCGFCVTDQALFSPNGFRNPSIFSHGDMVCLEKPL